MIMKLYNFYDNRNNEGIYINIIRLLHGKKYEICDNLKKN